MKVAILAGGVGTRIREETKTKPKGMVVDESQAMKSISFTKAMLRLV